MDIDSVRKQFDIIAKQYDKGRGYLIPCFEDFYVRSLGLIGEIVPAPKKIADLGAGTGLLSMELYRLYPDADFTLIDLSEEMMTIAKQRFKGLDNFTYVVADYVNNLPDDCDIIASALSIHHLEDNVKIQLYEKIFNKLNENGVFINLDQFCGDSEMISHAYDKWWFNYIDDSGIDDEAKDKWMVRKSLDREISLSQSMAMLRKVGFRDVQCIYSFMKFSTIVAGK